MPTPSNGDLEVVLAAEPDGGDDVVDGGRANDDGRSPVEHGVPHSSGIVVADGVGQDDLARE
jgi:hypothetical protein